MMRRISRIVNRFLLQTAMWVFGRRSFPWDLAPALLTVNVAAHSRRMLPARNGRQERKPMTRLRPYLLLLAITAILFSAMPDARFEVTKTSGPIICSCQLCYRTDVTCRISPTGFSIACADYFRLYCI
jgi:hypothetical protein